MGGVEEAHANENDGVGKLISAVFYDVFFHRHLCSLDPLVEGGVLAFHTALHVRLGDKVGLSVLPNN